MAMKKWMALSSVLLSSLAAWASGALLSDYLPYKGTPISLDVGVDYFKTTANFDSAGSKTNLIGSNYFQLVNFKTVARYPIAYNWNVLGGFNVIAAESSDLSFSRNSNGIDKITLGAEYILMNDVWIRSFVRTTLNYAVTKVDLKSDDAPISDGATEIIPEIIFNFDFENDVYTFAKAGINYRTEGFSTLLLYGVGSEVRFSSIQLGGSLHGFVSIKDDDYVNNKTHREGYNIFTAAGSLAVNSVNPSILNAEAHLGFKTGRLGYLKTFAGYTVLGTNIAEGFYLGAQFSWDIGHTFNIKPAHGYRAKPVTRESLFRENVDDGVNQNYFKSVNPEDKKYIQQIEKEENPEYKLKLKKKPRKPRK